MVATRQAATRYGDTNGEVPKAKSPWPGIQGVDPGGSSNIGGRRGRGSGRAGGVVDGEMLGIARAIAAAISLKDLFPWARPVKYFQLVRSLCSAGHSSTYRCFSSLLFFFSFSSFFFSFFFFLFIIFPVFIFLLCFYLEK